MHNQILYPMSPVNRAHPLAKGLLAWWLVHPALNSAGTRWRDLMGGYVGTLTNMAFPPTATSGWGNTMRIGGRGEVRFDGTNDRVLMGDRANWSFTAGGGVDLPFSISLAVNPTSVTNYQGLLSKREGATEWISYINASVLYFRCIDTTNTLWIGRSAPLGAATYQNKWFICTCTYSGNNASSGIRIYLNGVRADTADSNNGAYPGMTASVAQVEIGSMSGAQMFTGAEDDARIYNYALSPSMVSALYESSKVGYREELNWIMKEEYSSFATGVLSARIKDMIGFDMMPKKR